jgi:AraC-like DNA-binding protein
MKLPGKHHDQESATLAPASASIDAARKTDHPAGKTIDPMSDVLDSIRLRGALFFVWEPAAVHAVGVADGASLSRHIVPGTDRVISYHIVTRGSCWACVHGEPPLHLDHGDILVLPHGDAYKIADTPQYPSASDEQASIEFFKAMAAGDIPPLISDAAAGADTNRLICGFLGCDLQPANPLLSSLPRMIRVPAPRAGADPLSHLIDFALSESGQQRGGERCLLMRLSEVMFVEVLRRYLRLATHLESGWLNGLRDPLVGRALMLLHGDVARSWTLQGLARESGTSRTILAERFHRLVGLPPMQYLANWRMQAASVLLNDPSAKVYRVAVEVGYESEAAFSRAFKRITGSSPGAWRKQHQRATQRRPD